MATQIATARCARRPCGLECRWRAGISAICRVSRSGGHHAETPTQRHRRHDPRRHGRALDRRGPVARIRPRRLRLEALQRQADPLLVNSHDWTNEIIRPAIPEFEQLTGIKVAWEIFPEDQFRQKLAVEMVSGSGSVDGFMSLTSWDGLRFLKAGWYEPIEKYVKNPALTSPQFLFEDFFPNTRQIATVNGQLIGVPLYPEVELLYYRKDVFKAKNVAVPQTMEEWEEAAKKLTDKANNFYGFVS